MKTQLKELEASFAAQEIGGAASVSSKANLWKMREQAALASGENTVRPFFLACMSVQSSACYCGMICELAVLKMSQIRLASSTLKKGFVDAFSLPFICICICITFFCH
jgi:hypothetical protein